VTQSALSFWHFGIDMPTIDFRGYVFFPTPVPNYKAFQLF
jgi:hypothetical protein